MNRPRRTAGATHGGRLVGAALAALLLATCGVIDSARIDPVIAGAQVNPVCQSDLGTYALPKAFVHIVVAQTSATTPPDIVLTTDHKPVEVLLHPDPALVFCMDYLASPLHHDIITIKKFPYATGTDQTLKTSFLGAVMVNATDRTVFIIEALLRAAFIAASGDAGFTPRDISTAPLPAQTVADLEYDPFDPRESAEVNTRLTELGICLVLEGGYTFDRGHASVDAYCNAPRAHAVWLTPIVKAYLKAEETPANPALPGLLYRPRLPYRLAIFRKQDPKGPGRWRLSESQILKMENMSPVLSLDIRRTVFAGRATNFVFNNGALLTACVAKGSELEGFVDIPLQISRSIVALPTAVFQVRINQTKNEAALIQAETNLVKLQNAYLAALATGTFTNPAGVDSNLGAVPPSGNPTVLGLPKDLPNNATTGVLAGTPPAFDGDLFAANAAANNLDTLCTGGS
jgi:hypothetical protein